MLVALPLQAQDTVRIVHKNYSTVFSKSLRYPVLVEWWVTKARVLCVKGNERTDKFIPDPLLKDDTNLQADYTGSGLDRGHLAPAADFKCGTPEDMAETFYFSNMAPQYPSLNRGQWKALEEHIRLLAQQNDSIFVQAGCMGVSRRVKQLAVPVRCWKTYIVKRSGTKHGFIFPNVPNKSDYVDFTNYAVPFDSIVKIRK